MESKGIRNIELLNKTNSTSLVEVPTCHDHNDESVNSESLVNRVYEHDSNTPTLSSSTIVPTSVIDHHNLISLLQAFHHELEHPNETMTNSQRDEFLSLIESDKNYRTLTAVSIINPPTINDLKSIDTSNGIMKNPIILNKIENGGNDFQRVLDGTELLLRLLTETTNGNGVFRFEDHPSVSALIGYLYWFVGATGPAVAFSSMSEFSRSRIIQSDDNLASINDGSNGAESSGEGLSIRKGHSEIINGDLVNASSQSHGVVNHDDLLPRFTVMLVRNLVAPSHKNSIEADLNPLDGGSFLK